MRPLFSCVLALAVGALTACNGVGNSSLPAASASVAPVVQQSIPRRVIDAGGDMRTILYTVDVERSNLVGEGSPQGRVTLSTTSNNLLYHSGPVQTVPKIYVVFWGGTWTTTGDPHGVRTYLTNFLSRIGGSAWLSSVAQYTQTGGAHVGNLSGSFAGSWIDTSALPYLNGSTYQSYLAAEARKAAAHFANSTVSASYVIALPHAVKVYQFASGCNPNCFGTNDYCAWHGWTATSSGAKIAYTNLPYLPDAGPSCGEASRNYPGYDDGVSIVAGHEQAETETDPHLNAWYDANGNENGDKCAWTNLQDMRFGGTTLGTNEFPTQPLWSNRANSGTGGCVQ